MRFVVRPVTFILALCLLVLGIRAQAAAAASAADFYKGRTITVLSQFAEDAVLTVLSRIAAPYVEKYTGASVIVKPTPGAGGLLALNALYKAKPDGLTLILMAHGPKMVTSGLFNLQGVRYNWTKFVPLGKTVATNSCVIVAKNSPWKRPTDPAGKKFNYGESSPFFGPLWAQTYGWNKMTVIPGYSSTTGRAVAISRGEIQAASASNQTLAANPDLVKPLVCVFPIKGYPNAASLQSSKLPPAREKWAQQIEGWSNLLFMTVAPPGISTDRAKFLEGALKKVWADPGFRKGLEKVKQNAAPEFVTANELKDFMKSMAALSPKQVQEMKYVIRQKYIKKR